ncbi:hypothetical protein C6X99_18500 [Bacillus pumilus]|nr:hypothetical protein BAY68_15750 [Bacillus pumilus]PRS26850.1 hypothetical protein C6X99_18500 [Bacillus pumilus]
MFSQLLTHPFMKSATKLVELENYAEEFQSTHSYRMRQKGWSRCRETCYFNPRTHIECDENG